MINKILIVIASSLAIASVSFGIYSARELVTRTPLCYWDVQKGFSGLNYADTYMLLLIGIAIGASLMCVFYLMEGE